MRPDDGGGGVVLIDPQSLRRSASRLKGIGGDLRGLSNGGIESTLPTMPASVAGAVEAALAALAEATSQVPNVTDSASTELVRRAFWAEYADQIMAGYTLSGPAKQEFMNYLRDGTLLRYATPDEAAAAGKELALVTGDFRKDQTQLFLVAAALQGAERGGANGENLKDFCGAFVQQFGAKNMLLVPRVIQAMEWGRQIEFGGSTDPRLLRDVARNWTDQQLQTDPLRDLLAPFSIALANATYSSRLTQTTEDEIADDPDEFAVAALVSQGNRFDTHFLLQCFKNGVVQKIADDSRYYSMRNISGETPPVDPYAIGRMYSEGHGGLPVDTKQIFLDALARNPDAAAQALKPGSLGDVQVFDRFGNATTVNDPVTLIYQYGHFDDQGASLGHAYASAADYLGQHDRAQGARLTQTALVNLLDSSNDGNSAFKDGVGTDLAHNHIDDLFESAADDQAGNDLVAVAHGDQLRLSQTTLDTVLKSLSDRPSAIAPVLHAGAVYQAALIQDGTSRPPGADTSWAYKAAAFDASVLNANDLHRLDDFNAESAHHQLVTGFLKDVINDSLEIDNPVAGALVHNGVDAGIDNLLPGPDINKVMMDNAEAHATMQNALHAAITAGYYKHGYLASAPPAPTMLHGGQLISYADAKGDAMWDWDHWMNSDANVHHVTAGALQEVNRAYSERGIDLINSGG